MPDSQLEPQFFASASRGTETALAEELATFGITPIVEDRGGVAFGASLEDGYRACLWSRIASRVLLPLTVFEAESADELYAGVHAVPWTDHVGPERTLAVSVAGQDALAGPPHFIALKTKDAIVDRVREAEGARPSIDKQRPDVAIRVHVRGPRITVSLDFAGRGLHLRGHGRPDSEAPLRENFAAALLWIAGWRRGSELPLVDPLCGSGTFLCEAAAMALGVPPGLARNRIGAEGLRSHDVDLWARLRAEAHERRKAAPDLTLRIVGSDASRTAIEAASDAVKRAGFERHIRLEQRELCDLRLPCRDPGLVVTNPPYGMRLGEVGEWGPLYELLGDVLKRRFPGWTAWVLSGNRALDKRIGLRPKSRHVVFNGPIECRWLEVPIKTEPVTGDTGPGWRRAGVESKGFARRLAANARELEGWAKKEGITAYRVYDSDVPEYNFAIDRYGAVVRVEEYPRPRKVDNERAERRLADALRVVPEVLDVDATSVVARVRQWRAPEEQPDRFGDSGRFVEVQEGDLRFRVNLTDYLDTGLFVGDRLLRRRLRDMSGGRRFLNLFAYTCSASVAAAAGGAQETTSVDPSARYLDWGKENFLLNDLDPRAHRFVKVDGFEWLRDRHERTQYDLIFCAPPSRAHDLRCDHGALLTAVAARLAPGGTILFSTRLRELDFDAAALREFAVQEITEQITTRDFARRPALRAWEIRRSSVS